MSKRYVVTEARKGHMEFLGVAPAGSPEQAIATVRRYAMRPQSVQMKAREMKVTKK